MLGFKQDTRCSMQSCWVTFVALQGNGVKCLGIFHERRPFHLESEPIIIPCPSHVTCAESIIEQAK